MKYVVKYILDELYLMNFCDFEILIFSQFFNIFLLLIGFENKNTAWIFILDSEEMKYAVKLILDGLLLMNFCHFEILLILVNFSIFRCFQLALKIKTLHAFSY